MRITHVAALSLLLVAGCTRPAGGKPPKERGDTPLEQDCRQAIEKLLKKDFAAWSGLPATACTVAAVGQVLPLGSEPTRGLVGEAGHVAHHRLARTDAYEEVRVWYRDEQVVKIQVIHPGIGDPSSLLKQLGEPDSKLDRWIPSIPKLNKGGEWVWAARGMSFLLSRDHKHIVEISVFAPTTADGYRRDLYHLGDPPEEFPH